MNEFDFESNGDLSKVSEVLFNVLKQIIPDAEQTKFKFSKIDSDHKKEPLYCYKYSSYSVKFTKIEKYWYIYCKTMVQSIGDLKCSLQRTGYYLFDIEKKRSTYFEEKYIFDDTIPFIDERQQIISGNSFRIAKDGKNNLEELEQKARVDEKKKKEEEEKKTVRLKKEEEEKNIIEKEKTEKRTLCISSTIKYILDFSKENSYLEKVVKKLISREISDEVQIKAENSYGVFFNKNLSVKIIFNDENKYPVSNAEKIIEKVSEKIVFVMKAKFESIEYEKRELDNEKDVKPFIEKLKKAEEELSEIEKEINEEDCTHDESLIGLEEINDILQEDDSDKNEIIDSITFDEISFNGENSKSSEKSDNEVKEQKNFENELNAYLDNINNQMPLVQKTEYLIADEAQKKYKKLKEWLEKNALEIIGDIDIFLNDFCFAFRKGKLRKLTTAEIKTMFENEDFHVIEVCSRELTKSDLYDVLKHQEGAWLKEKEEFDFFYVRVSSDSLFFTIDSLGVF